MSFEYFGVDGTVYKATVEGPEWGPVTLHRIQDNRLDDVIRLLRSEAEACLCRVKTPDDPEAIWGALLANNSDGRRVAPADGGGADAEGKNRPGSAVPHWHDREHRGMCLRSALMVNDVEERGCGYCRDDNNMHFGHVEQVAADEDQGVLLRCPDCGWLYLDPCDGLSEPRHIDSVSAETWFGYST